VDKKIPETYPVHNLTAIEHPASVGIKELQKQLAALL